MKRLFALLAILMFMVAYAIPTKAQATYGYPTFKITAGGTVQTLTLDSASGYKGTYLQVQGPLVKPAYTYDSIILPSATKVSTAHFTTDRYQAGSDIVFPITTLLYIRDKRGLRYFLIKQP